MTEEEQNHLYLKNRELLQKIKDSSEDDFEKNLIYITSGTLVLSMTFIEKIAPLENAKGVLALVIGWVFLTVSLLINLISHRISAQNSRNRTAELDRGDDWVEINKRIDNDNYKLDRINDWTVGSMILGIFALVVYCSINAFQMSNLQPEKKGETVKPSSTDKLSNGRTMSTIIVPKPQPTTSAQTPKNSGTKK